MVLKLVLVASLLMSTTCAYLSSMGGYYSSLNTAQNLTSSIGKTVHLNCSLYDTTSSDHFAVADEFEYSAKYASVEAQLQQPQLSFNPTWLKADYVYNQNGQVESHRIENIIVTRKGVVADVVRHKIKVVNGERVQALKITDLDVRDEGKYVCRELSANIDRAFYLSVFCKSFTSVFILILIDFSFIIIFYQRRFVS